MTASDRFRCGDAECWCTDAAGLVVSPECRERPPADLQRRPFHRGYWLALARAKEATGR